MFLCQIIEFIVNFSRQQPWHYLFVDFRLFFLAISKDHIKQLKHEKGLSSVDLQFTRHILVLKTNFLKKLILLFKTT